MSRIYNDLEELLKERNVSKNQYVSIAIYKEHSSIITARTRTRIFIHFSSFMRISELYTK